MLRSWMKSGGGEVERDSSLDRSEEKDGLDAEGVEDELGREILEKEA